MQSNQIKNYDLEENEIFVTTSTGEEIEINRAKFEDFLRFNFKLEFCIDWSEAGDHKQHSGTMDLNEYWELNYLEIHKDIAEYLTQESLPKDFLGGTLQNIQSILRLKK